MAASYQPDVLISMEITAASALTHATAGEYATLPFYCLQAQSALTPGTLGGIEHCPEEIGIVAARHISAKLLHHNFGLTDLTHLTLVRGREANGKSFDRTALKQRSAPRSPV